MELMQSALIQIVDIAMPFFEFVGVFALIATGLRGIMISLGGPSSQSSACESGTTNKEEYLWPV